MIANPGILQPHEAGINSNHSCEYYYQVQIKNTYPPAMHVFVQSMHSCKARY